jgi:ABC-type transporter Mla subunit MlaD
MALQDLTPQLRTRLSRMERAVGWFVILATALLVFGLVYYVYSTAERKGWFLTRARYFTFTDRATGLKVGDPVTLMGFPAGEITAIKPMPADRFDYNVYVEFDLKWPNYGYMWTEGSRARITSADFLGNRVVEVTRGTGGYPSYISYDLQQISLDEVQNLPDLPKWKLGQELLQRPGTNLLAGAFSPLTATNLAAFAAAGYTNILVVDTRQERKSLTGVWKHRKRIYEPYTNSTSKYWLISDETAAVTERLEQIVGVIEKALPNFLALTNQLTATLSNAAAAASNLNLVAASARPVASNLSAATANLDHPGALGEWLLPTNLAAQLQSTLTGANATLAHTDTNLTELVENLARSLDNLADITSNLNAQVQANTNMLGDISRAVVHTDDLVQGLKQHWLLRSAFKVKNTNAPPPPPPLIRP